MIGTALLKHLSCVGELSDEDAAAVESVKGEVRAVDRHRDVLKAGQRPRHSVVVLAGFVARYSIGTEGKRQFHSFYMPTDAPCLEALHIDYMDNNLGALVDSQVGLIQLEALYDLMSERPKVLSLIWRATLIQAAIFREWLLRNSTLPAHSAMAHLFCEIFVRAKAADLVDGNTCDLPVTQEVLGEALGLTAVHVNRTLQVLRRGDLVDLKNGKLIVIDFDRLAEIGAFDPKYLHLRS